MAPVIPDPEKIRSFRTAREFEAWLRVHHDGETELWLKIHRKATGLPTVTYAQALDVALCWGWIDGIKKSFDDRSFPQRFTPRRPKSVWSQIKRDHLARLTATADISDARAAEPVCPRVPYEQHENAYGPCPECAEAILPEARRCPYCRSSVTAQAW